MNVEKRKPGRPKGTKTGSHFVIVSIRDLETFFGGDTDTQVAVSKKWLKKIGFNTEGLKPGLPDNGPSVEFTSEYL